MLQITTTYIDTEDVETMRSLPRNMSFSKISRCLLTALRTDDKQWNKLLKKNPELLETKNWIRDRIMRKMV